MRKLSHGRGWHRIGVVLSVIWFVGFFGFMMNEGPTKKAHITKF